MVLDRQWYGTSNSAIDFAARPALRWGRYEVSVGDADRGMEASRIVAIRFSEDPAVAAASTLWMLGSLIEWRAAQFVTRACLGKLLDLDESR